ncbi:MAG: hypothetical protein FWG99_03360 [Treponema sp.]|nr:hypothetical protein [Treponema sp.]
MIASVLIYVLMPRGRPVILQKSDELFEIVNDGDIICRLGDRFWSQVFKDTSVTDKRYSHMGIIRIVDGTVTVVHAEGTLDSGKDFVKEQSFNDFIKIARAIGIYRTKNIDGIQISNTSVEYLGAPFDWKFDMDNESEIYCTELLYLVFKQLMPEIELKTIYIKELGKEIIPLEAISNSEYFSEIYYKDNW